MLGNVYFEGNRVKVEVWSLTPHTLGVIAAGSPALTVADPAGLVNADPYFVAAAGPETGHLVTTIASISGNLLTLSAAAAESVKRAMCGKRVDPSTQVFRVKRPDNTIDIFTAPNAAIANPLIGKWVLSYDPATDGWYTWRFEGTGTAFGAVEGAFHVKSSQIV